MKRFACFYMAKKSADASNNTGVHRNDIIPGENFIGSLLSDAGFDHGGQYTPR
jgi:hypothetical protein